MLLHVILIPIATLCNDAKHGINECVWVIIAKLKRHVIIYPRWDLSLFM